MSSSVFIESSSQAADASNYASTSDSNLVVVYGKNGISFDDKGLENLIEEKKISSISVIRLTSPTPSMQDEEDEAEKLEEMLRRQELGSAEESFGSEEEANSSSGDDKNDTAGNGDSSNDDDNGERKAYNESDNESSEENKTKQRKQPRRRGRQPNIVKQKKTARRRKRERPEIVGLRLEEFYPPEDANEIIKEALKMAGLQSDKKSKSDYDFQLFVIQNDHCYTPFTSPTQMKAKLAADKLEAEKQAASRKVGVLQPTAGKQLFVRKKQTQQNLHAKTENLLKSNVASGNLTKDKGLAASHKFKKDTKDRQKPTADEDFADDDEANRTSFEENDAEAGGVDDESDLSGSEESAETDNDRDSDLDFDVNNPKGRKRKVKLLKTQKRVLSVGKVNQKSRRFCSQDEPAELPNKTTISSSLPTCSPSTLAQRQKSIVKIISDPGRITVRSTPSKVVHLMGSNTHNTLSPAIAALPPIPKKQNENKILLNTTTSTATPVTFSSVAATSTSVTLSPKTFVFVKGPIEQKSAVQSSPQTHKEIIINKQVMSSPKTKGFTDLTTLIEQTEKQTPIKVTAPPTTPKSSHTATITSVVTLTPTSTAALKGFMPIETAAKNQLPAQISIQTHQSSSELEAEHDKQLDLINSIVQDEMKKSNEKADEQIRNINENIPELVKMLESTEKVLVNTNTQRGNVTETTQNINQLTDVSSNNSSSVNKNITGQQSVKHLPAPASVTPVVSTNNLVGGIDITSASLLATPEGEADDTDDLPDDILQQVVELIKDDKTLQEAVEKQVFGTGVCSDQIMNNNLIVNQNPPPLAPISQQPVTMQEIPQTTPSKSIIQMAISNVPTTLPTPVLTTPQTPVITTRTTIITPTTSTTATGQISKISPLIRKEPIQIIRGNGRVITLPPIEAPTTRAKRRAQAQPNTSGATASASVSNTSFVAAAVLSESSLDSSMHSNSSMTAASGSSAATVQEKKVTDANNRRRGSKETIMATGSAAAGATNQKVTKTQKAAAKKGAAKASAAKAKVETEATDSEEDDDDDPNKLWCICRQPHNNRFMICCDVCEDWFHGTCVSITKAMGLEMEQKGIDWTCPKCLKKQEEKKQPKITEMLIKKPNEPTTTPVVISSTPPTLITTVVGSIANVSNTTTTNVTTSSIDILNITPKKDSNVQNLETSSHIKLQSGQIINLKDYSMTTNKRATIIQTSTSSTTGNLTAGQKKLYVTSGQANLKMASQPGNPIRTITVVKQLSTPPQLQQHHNIKIIKTITPTATAASGTSLNISTTAAPATTTTPSVPATVSSTPTSSKVSESSTLCIVCKKIARSNSIYCSDDCIRKHAQNALNTIMHKTQTDSSATSSPLNKSVAEDKTKRKPKGLFEELLSAADRKPKVERVNVYERKSGRVITGNSAPTVVNLKKWLQDNPTFEVIQPGSAQALELEKKQKLRTQYSSSPTILKSAASSPPPLKMFSVTSSAAAVNKNDSNSGTSQGHSSPQIQIKTNKNITDFLKTTSSSTSTSPRPNTPKQLQKYPQQVGIKPDKVAKTPEDAKNASKDKTSTTKRQTSTESAGKSSGHDGEPIRGVVRRTLKEQLLLRIKEETSSSTDTETNNETINKVNNMPKLSEEEVEEFAKATELEMYHYFNRDTGTKYKAKYRSLVFNIKDRKNHTLFAKICGKLIEPKQLVRMSPEELASQELAQWREQENKHQLEMIKKSELDLLACAKNYVLKTHKGEEVIEGKSSDYASVDITIPVEDVVSALNKSELPDDSTSAVTRKESLTHWPEADSTLLSHSHLLSPTVTHTLHDEDKTKSSSSHLKEKDREREKEKDREREKDKERSRGREREREKRHKSKDRHHDKSRSRKRSRSHSRSRSRDKGEKRHKSSHKEEKREREERVRGDKERVKDRTEREHHSDGNERKTSSTETKKSTAAQSKQPSKKHHEQPTKAAINPLETYNLIDQILESTKTVEEAANLVSDRDKEKESESYRKNTVTPQPVQAATSTVSTSSGSADSAIVVDIPSNLSSTESDQEPSSTVSIPTPPHDPYSRFIACSSPSSSYSSDLQYTVTSLWTGNINMVDVTSFQLTLQPIVGNSIGLAKLLPKELDVVGRIGPETVWDYISKIKKSPNKEIVVIRLIPANESETIAYKILYEYLDNRKRLGVIKSTSSQIKDFYIYPLGAGKNVPALLQPSEPVDFYDDPYRPDVLIGIIIRVVVSKRANPISSQTVLSGAGTSSMINKLSNRVNDTDTFTPPGSPKPKKHRQTIATHKVDEIDIDAIIKAPIAAKAQKATIAAPLTKLNDADEPYSPGGSSDDDLPLLPVKMPSNVDHMQAAEDELKRKMEEINRQIAAQEMEIAGLLTGEPTAFGSASASSSNVLANISIPSNLSQILASIKTTGKDQSVVPPPPPLIGSLLKSSSGAMVTSATEEEYNPAESMGSTFEDKNSATGSNTSSTSLLAKLSEAELLSMVPDDIVITPNKPTRYEEPPPPGV
ncbi:serine-rich adhesin for platelets [Lucilia sericata]|uniref:serine-rich adhesin for platelets n=1 Tax=Lucilia sericata TaxID=13632 RepID=UPI0018A8020D|nr:serine-rich adhesin for platelets [Lucilia sericata]